MIEYPKKYTRPKDPVYLNSFILAYSKVIMNECIDAFDGFTDWNKTFYYTDTDSLHIKFAQLLELLKRKSEIVGKNLGQLHDDIEEVNDGKIFWSIFINPKTYIDIIIGFIIEVDEEIGYYKAKENYDKAEKNKNDELMHKYKKEMEEIEPKRELTVVEHVRAKRVQKEFRDKKMHIEDFERMFFNDYIMTFDMTRFSKAHKDAEKPGLQLVSNTVQIGRNKWKGRKLDRENNRWIPKTYEEIQMKI